MFQLLIADDHPLFRVALTEAINNMDKAIDIKEASNYYEAEDLLRKTEVDLLLLDLKMPGNEGLMGLIRLRSRFPQVGIVIVSATEQSAIIASARAAGAMGYIPKSSSMDAIQTAIDQVLDGQLSFPEQLSEDDEQAEYASKIAALTPQQLRVLNMLAKGSLNKQIAFDLNVKETTIKTHISEIFKKLGINNRTQAALIVQQLGLEDEVE